MPDTTRKQISDAMPRSAMPLGGTSAILFGLLFALPGLLVVLLGIGAVTYTGVRTHAPGWLILVCGSIFALAGVWMIWSGIASKLRYRRAVRAYFERSPEPWVWDHAWNHYGTRDAIWARVVRQFVVLGGLLLFLTPFNALVFASEADTAARFCAGPFVLLFDLLLIYMAALAVRELLRAYKFGRTQLEYEHFPMFLGKRAPMRVVLSRPVEAPDGLVCTLRFIEEVVETTESGGKRTTRVNCYQLYEDSLVVHPQGAGDGRQTARIEFHLPKGAYETRLSLTPPRYWQLDVTASTPGVDLEAKFLLPVYGLGPADLASIAGKAV